MLYDGYQHVTIAAKDIQEGDQIYASYNMCLGCGGRRHFYGTGGELLSRVVVAVRYLPNAVTLIPSGKLHLARLPDYHISSL